MKTYKGLFSTSGTYIVEIKAKNKEEAWEKFNNFNFGQAQIVEDYRENDFEKITKDWKY